MMRAAQQAPGIYRAFFPEVPPESNAPIFIKCSDQYKHYFFPMIQKQTLQI